MMKHDTIGKTIALEGSSNNAKVPSGVTPPAKRSLWRYRSASEAPPTARSPITKAFDFLPWSRSKKSTDKSPSTATASVAAAAAAATAPEATIMNGNTSTALATLHDNKKDVLHYHRNIFRNGGGLIRDILGDKLHKEKANNEPPLGGQKQLNGAGGQRKPKQVVARNKSLDIKELIDCVENELAAGEKQKNGHCRFLDDTFIENIMRVKEQYQRNLEDEDDADECAAEEYENEGYYHADDGAHTYPYTRSSANASPNGSTGGNTSPKHILFNDENIVYLIKKELPVKREMSKLNDNVNRVNKKMPPGGEKNEVANANANVLRARLKFKKLTPETSPLSSHKLPSVLNNNQTIANQRNYQASKSVVESYGKRGILHRQNTSPASATHGGHCVASPELSRRQVQQQRLQPPSPRRKSLTETGGGGGYDNSQYDNSSSSSMGSGGGSATGGIIADRPKTDKPRKKLSFREPVVSEKRRARRRSSPMQRTTSGHLAADDNSTSTAAAPVVNNRHSFCNSNNIGNNCDNLSKWQDNQYARNGAAEHGICSTYADNKDLESQAMRIVRTVGQAFEVCHKFNLHKNSLDHNDERSDASSELLDVEHISEPQMSDVEDAVKKDQLAVSPELNAPQQRPNHLELVPQANLNMRKSPNVLTDDDKSPTNTTPTSPSREIIKLKDQLEQQAMQTRQALAQLMLVREQLISETNARIEAQARTQQLLQQNRELLEHLASLGAYTEQQTPGLTSANIGMAPQSQLQMLLQATSNNNNLATINQQLSNLGSINQQLTSLSHQLSGLNQQSQNLQNFQNISASLQQTPPTPTPTQQASQQQQPQPSTPQPQTLTPPVPSTSLHQSQLHLNVSAANANAGSSPVSTLSSSPYPSMNQLQSISNQLQQINVQHTQQQQQQDALSKDLFQVNQELLNRLQALNLGASTSAALALNTSPLPTTAQQTSSPHNSFFFANPMSCSPSNNNSNVSNFNFLSSPSPLGTLTPSPMGTLNRNSYSNSPITDEMRLSIDKNLNSLDEHLMKPLAQLSVATSNGNIAGSSGTRENSRSSSTVDSPSSPRPRSGNGNNNNEPRFNTVMLKVTDESGNVTNQRKLSATPSFITRSTSEKVPNRSQMMSQVQRTAWARHTTK